MSNDAEIPKCFDNPDQAAERITELFVDVSQRKRIDLGQCPAERAVFRKLHGVASGRLVMEPNIPEQLKVGVFKHDSLEAWVRFSSDTTPTSPDLNSTLGIGIKLFGVPGPKALGDDGDTADFIMQNYPVFFVDTAKEMVEFTYAGVVAKDYPGYLAKHPQTKKITDDMGEKVEGSVLTAHYWSVLPFKSGEGRHVKYRLDPVTPAQNIANDDPDYLATDLANRLRQREYQFKFMVQLGNNDDSVMPLDRATVEWPTSISPFVHVATLTLSQQDVTTRGQAQYGQGLAFNIWRLPLEQSPVGSIAIARRMAYAASARLRHESNGQSLKDPSEPRQAAGCPYAQITRANATEPQGKDECIVKAVIYPSIGIARVGSSKEYFIGPEVDNPVAQPAGFYRDAAGALKRQAARFRVYGVNAKGQIVRELTPDNAKIDWHVQLANTKSAWYGFQLALDIPEAATAVPTTLRNPGVADRQRLAITPQPRSISGKKNGPQIFDDGQFMGKHVYLGEMSTDADGRLVVLGGLGKSASWDESRAITFANNEGWHDDVSDGPVTADVVYDGQSLIVVPAWVVVAPPNYGPHRKTVRTMWDLMRDVAIKAGLLPKPARPSFTFDIQPIFESLAGLQWVNAGFAAGFGWKGTFDLTSPEALARLSCASSANAQLRKTIANQFRNDAVDGWSPKPWPWLYGDAMASPAAQTPRQNASLSATQLSFLAQWAEGDFVEDYDAGRKWPEKIEDVALAEQGDMLTKAALDFCLADAFHPGCEMTWPVRTASMYSAPFRFEHAPKDWIAPGLGESITYDAITLPHGPLAGQQAGGITRWMAVPWQTDTASCRSGYDQQYDPYVPSFWPARVPNQVLTSENYDIVMDKSKPLSERQAAFANRASWIEPLGNTGYTDQINNMIKHFDHLGVVAVRPGPERDDPEHRHFPAHIEVEDQHVLITSKTHNNAEHQSHKQDTSASIGVLTGPRPEAVGLMFIDRKH